MQRKSEVVTMPRDYAPIAPAIIRDLINYRYADILTKPSPDQVAEIWEWSERVLVALRRLEAAEQAAYQRGYSDGRHDALGLK